MSQIPKIYKFRQNRRFFGIFKSKYCILVAKLGGKIKLNMFLIQTNKQKYKNCKHLPFEVTKTEFDYFSIEKYRLGRCDTPPTNLDFDGLP